MEEKKRKNQMNFRVPLAVSARLSLILIAILIQINVSNGFAPHIYIFVSLLIKRENGTILFL